MAKASQEQVIVAEEAPVAPTMPLVQFCSRLSETVKRPELIGAFEHVERLAGRINGTEAEYRQRFDAFINAPA